jgi:uroporphyrinogen-III synthase
MQLRGHGFAAETLPLIEISAVSPEIKGRARFEDYAALVFVSVNAVRGFFDEKSSFLESNSPLAQAIRARAAMKNIAGDMLQESPRLLAPGPGTVAALHEAGVPLTQIDAPAPNATQFDSEALWQNIGQRDWSGKRVLIVRGRNGPLDATASSAPGRDWIAAQWRAAGAQVDFVTVYQRVAPTFTAPERQLADAARADGSVWLFSSSEAVANLAAAMPLDFSEARALATHPRIAQSVRRAGWRVVAESRPAIDDVVQALRSIEWLEP